ncbi:MAG: hypothetical protein IJA14_00095 [Alphaproteobacteria bacterium]|nr:hypothetical protein [Alphaproteobacteria bacterium]
MRVLFFSLCLCFFGANAEDNPKPSLFSKVKSVSVEYWNKLSDTCRNQYDKITKSRIVIDAENKGKELIETTQEKVKQIKQSVAEYRIGNITDEVRNKRKEVIASGKTLLKELADWQMSIKNLKIEKYEEQAKVYQVGAQRVADILDEFKTDPENINEARKMIEKTSADAAYVLNILSDEWVKTEVSEFIKNYEDFVQSVDLMEQHARQENA